MVGGDSATYYSSTDDYCFLKLATTYSGARDAASADGEASPDTLLRIGQDYASGEASPYAVWRAVMPFDTSGLPDTATISAATLALYVSSLEDKSDTDFDVTVVSYSGDNPPAVDDFSELGSTSGGSISTADWTGEQYNNITLNATGRGWISKTGSTLLGLRSSRDISNTTPSGREYAGVWSANRTGTTYDPKLTITYYVDVTLTPPPGWLTVGSGTPIAGVILTVQAPPGHLSLWPGVPDVGVYVVVSPPSGLLAIGTASPSILAGAGYTIEPPPGHFTLWPKGGVHEAPHLPYPLKVSRTRPSHWFSSRRDIVRK